MLVEAHAPRSREISPQSVHTNLLAHLRAQCGMVATWRGRRARGHRCASPCASDVCFCALSVPRVPPAAVAGARAPLDWRRGCLAPQHLAIACLFFAGGSRAEREREQSEAEQGVQTRRYRRDLCHGTSGAEGARVNGETLVQQSEPKDRESRTECNPRSKADNTGNTGSHKVQGAGNSFWPSGNQCGRSTSAAAAAFAEGARVQRVRVSTSDLLLHLLDSQTQSSESGSTHCEVFSAFNTDAISQSVADRRSPISRHVVCRRSGSESRCEGRADSPGRRQAR